MEPNDQMKKDIQDKRTRTRLSGQNQPARETGYTPDNQSPPISGQKNPRTRTSSNYNRGSGVENSQGSSLNKILGAAGIVAGGALLFKLTKGFSKKTRPIELHSKETIKRSREELYSYWRNLENLPNFMSHIKEISEIDERRSRWTAKIPGGVGTVDWEAVIDQDRKNEFISWRSIGDSDIQNSGEVRFKSAGRGKTIVETYISYRPPAGKVGEFTAKLLNPAFEKIVKNDLKQFKKHMEQGGDEHFKREYSDILY